MDGSDGGYDIVELFVLKFVLADVIIIAALLFAGPLVAVAITALLVASTFLLWYITRETDGQSTTGTAGEDTESEPAIESGTAGVDPVTALQRRYASGELSEAEFERALDQLLAADERAADADVKTTRLSLERE